MAKTIIEHPSKKRMEYLEREQIPYQLKNDILIFDDAYHIKRVLKYNADPIEVNFKTPQADGTN